MGGIDGYSRICVQTHQLLIWMAHHKTQQLSKPNLGELAPFPRCPRRKRSIFRRGECRSSQWQGWTSSSRPWSSRTTARRWLEMSTIQHHCWIRNFCGWNKKNQHVNILVGLLKNQQKHVNEFHCFSEALIYDIGYWTWVPYQHMRVHPHSQCLALHWKAV